MYKMFKPTLMENGCFHLTVKLFFVSDPPQLWLRLGQNLAEDQIKVCVLCNDNKHCNKNEMYFSFRKGMMFTSPVMSALILTLALLPGNMM